MMSYLSIIGKRFEAGGLGDLMVESGIVATGSLSHVMSGKHYNRAIRSHRLMYEALSRLRISQFMADNDDANTYMMEADNMSTTYKDPSFMDSNHTKLEGFWEQYTSHATERSLASPTYQYWSSYLDMVQLLLLFLRATRVSNWDLHLSTIEQMLPWFFAYNRTNYSRYAILLACAVFQL